jgi:hypothetical protein
LHGSMSDEGSDDEKGVNWKRRVYAAGHDLLGRPASVQFYKIFLVLIAIHTSIFIVNWEPLAGIILLLSLLKGWSNV